MKEVCKGVREELRKIFIFKLFVLYKNYVDIISCSSRPVLPIYKVGTCFHISEWKVWQQKVFLSLILVISQIKMKRISITMNFCANRIRDIYRLIVRKSRIEILTIAPRSNRRLRTDKVICKGCFTPKNYNSISWHFFLCFRETFEDRRVYIILTSLAPHLKVGK